MIMNREAFYSASEVDALIHQLQKLAAELDAHGGNYYAVKIRHILGLPTEVLDAKPEIQPQGSKKV